MEPAPVRVENDLGLLGGATAGGTLLGSQGRVSFGLVGSNLLAANASEDREDDGEFAVHREEDQETKDEEGGYEWRRRRVVVVVRKEEERERGLRMGRLIPFEMSGISIAKGGSL